LKHCILFPLVSILRCPTIIVDVLAYRSMEMWQLALKNDRRGQATLAGKSDFGESLALSPLECSLFSILSQESMDPAFVACGNNQEVKLF